jgi:hypothetical protein
MGKAADNERRKLSAALLNNVAVGLIVGGAFLPLLLMITRTANFGPWFNDWWSGKVPINPIEALALFASFLAMALAFWLANRFHRSALKILEQLED